MRPPLLLAVCCGISLVAGYLGGTWSSTTPSPTHTAPLPATTDTAGTDAFTRDLEALRTRVARLEQAQVPVDQAAAARDTPITAAPPSTAPPVRPAPTAPDRAEPHQPEPEVDEWARFGGRDNFSEAHDLVDELPTLKLITNRRLQRELKLEGESAETLKAAVDAAATQASELGTNYLAGKGDLAELRRRWAQIETRFTAATATLTPDERADVDRIIASVFQQREWVAPLLRGASEH